MTKKQSKKYHHSWYLAHRENQIKLAKLWSKAHPNEAKASKLKYDYNLSLEDYNKMLIHQDNRCALCRIYRKLVVDHDHKTGRVRGLLCNSCNLALRYFENEETFNKILKYIQKQVALQS
ncbi:MAG: endonuclease VII domain-containing protein [bacterium]